MSSSNDYNPQGGVTMTPAFIGKPVVPLSYEAVRSIAPALATLTTATMLVLAILIVVIPFIPIIRRRVARRCYDREVARHPSFSPKGFITILRSVGVLIITVTLQVCITAVAEGGVDTTLLTVFAFAITTSLIFVMSFVFGGDFSLAFLVNLLQLGASIVNFSYLNKKVPFVEVLAVLVLLQVAYWTAVMFKLWMLNELAVAVDQMDRMGFGLPVPLKERMYALAGRGARRNVNHGPRRVPAKHR